MISCIIISQDTLHVQHKSMQAALLRAFFHSCSEGFMERASSGDKIENICHWPNALGNSFSVVCRDDEVRLITIEGHRECGNFNLNYLPQSVEHVHIASCFQSYPIEARLLPKSASTIYMMFNQLYGSIDLWSLPRNLTELCLANNEISGTLNLFNLPESLRYVWLQNNRIIQETLFYGELPKTLRKFNLEGNHIGRVKAVASEWKQSGIFNL